MPHSLRAALPSALARVKQSPGAAAPEARCTDSSFGACCVVGWSFGGLLARWLAHERPDAVRRVICLGSPWRPEGEVTRTTAMFERAADKHGLSPRAREIVATVDDAELFLYPGDQHYFADSSLPSYDAEATALLTRRVSDFLARV